MSLAMNTIDSYNFGQIIINGRKYTSDVIIFPDRVQGDWWRDEGHELNLKDISLILREKPEILVVGTGTSGLMKVLPDVEKEAAANNIRLIIQPTDEACKIYNKLSPTQKIIAALHLAC